MALQMTWQPSLLQQKRKSGAPLGLKNLGNTCYLNSVLQCLTYTPPLANFCLKNQHSSFCDSGTESDRKRDCPFCILEKRIVRSLSVDLTLDTPAKISNCLRIFAEHFRLGRQEDAHEFLRYVIDACHNTCLRLKKLQQQRRKGGVSNGNEAFTGSTVVKEIFGGALQSQVKCLSCGTESNKVDEIMDISLDVLHSSSLKESMQKFFQSEVLDGSNKYKCENCKKLVAARKQMSLLEAPNVLVIQLKRFEGIFGGKIDKAIAFEEVLVLSSYMCKASQDLHPEYNLFGTIVHSGFSPDSGHYYAYIKDAMSHWYCCNDSYVSHSTLQEVLAEKVYILFFSRTKQRPVPATPACVSNGIKSRDSNGSHTSKISKAANPIKALHSKPIIDSSEKNNSTKSKIDKIPSSLPVKVSSYGNSGATKLSAPSNGKIRKGPLDEKNGDMKASSICIEKSGKNIMPFVISNGNSKSKTADAVNVENRQGSPSVSGDSKTQSTYVNSIDAGRPENHRETVKAIMGRGTNSPESQNGSVSCPTDTAGSKRKLQNGDSCSLFAKDDHFHAKLDELKEVLGKEASLVLQSCGWSDKVYSFMRSRKKLCAREAGGAPNGDELRKLLISQAKQTFITQIPESLKENLIERLRSACQEK